MSKKNKIQHKPRQRQRLSNKQIIAIATGAFMLIAGVTFVFYNFSGVENSFGHGLENPKIIHMDEQKFSDEFSIPAKVLSGKSEADANTIMIKQVKPVNQ